MRTSPAPTDDDHEPPSKSELKRQSTALQNLGRELTDLPDSRLAGLDLPENLRDALHEYHRIRSHEGRRRHLQFIGKLMRHTDPAPLREAVAAYKLGSAKDTLALHLAERWRDRMLADDQALTEWLAAHPESDVQHLRSLVRSARKDVNQANPEGIAPRHGRAYRDLFQSIKAALAAMEKADREAEESDDE